MNRTTTILALVTGLAAGCGPALAGDLYRIQPGTTTIGFSVDHLGLFSTAGTFGRFEGNLLLNLDDPSRSRVEVRVDTTSVAVPSDLAADMLRSADYFDPARFPQLRFKAVSVKDLGNDRVEITGDLTIRDITRREILQAELTGRNTDPVTKAEVADFVASGTVERADFGMTADQDFVSNDVRLVITAHIRLDPGG
ncbi:YceI family protein [Zavarzinia sp.]|uniref:YceI family protein n=1 Tax=Zavarzinia sp. TaxID=2027920 RepID=UPI003BB4E2D5|nr:YceI family protein [Zavarzinia sp.]